MANPIVQMRKVSKTFGDLKAMDDLDFEIYPGTIVGLIGDNGAGKSTLLRHIIGLYLPDEGKVNTFDCDAEKLGPDQLARIGYVHQEGELLDWMTVKQLIRYVSAYYPGWNHELEKEYISDFDISMKARVGVLSPGQRQRLAILLAIGFEPELLILDEPASGLDPIARAKFLDMLLGIIQDENRAIIISSHILSDIEKVIDHTVIMKAGRLLRDCGFDDLREEFCTVRLKSLNGELPEELGFENVVACERGEFEAVLTVGRCSEQQLQAAAKKLNCRIETQALPLEEIYKIVVSE